MFCPSGVYNCCHFSFANSLVVPLPLVKFTILLVYMNFYFLIVVILSVFIVQFGGCLICTCQFHHCNQQIGEKEKQLQS
uniref:Uncharacterized protein n=1 Tax=Octopus bimaculoides TaxID=37653 RepID=A0A0L8FJN9_OCTBM